MIWCVEMVVVVVVGGVRYRLPWRCMQRTVEVCPYRVCTHSPLSASHTRSVRSVEPLITVATAIWLHHTPPV